MAFTSITNSRRPRKTSPGRQIKVRVTKEYPKATFLLSRPLAEQMGFLPGDRLVIEMGTGADFGTFRLTKADPYPQRGNLIRATRSRHYFEVHATLPRNAEGVDRQEYAKRFPDFTECAFEFDADTQIITVTVPVDGAALDDRRPRRVA